MKTNCGQKTVGIVWHSHFPWNRGVGRLAKTLFEHGWRVLLLTRNLKNAPSFEQLPYAEVFRVPNPKQRKLGDLIYYHSPVNPCWLLFICGAVRREGISLLIVRDLPLALVTGLSARMLGIPAVLDMREYYPAFVSTAPNRRGIRRITKSRFLNDKLENLCMRFFDRVFVVVPEVKNKLTEKGYDAERIDIISYFPDRPNLNAIEDKWNGEHRTLQFVYAGGSDQRRGLIGLVKAAGILKEQGYDFRLTMATDRSPEMTTLREKTKQFGLTESIIFRDLFAPDELIDSLKGFHVGIINHMPCEHTEHTLPMKLFEYMSAGLAIASSNMTPVRRILEAERCGLVFPGSQPEEIANILSCFISDKKLTRNLGENSFCAAVRKYNWEGESIALVRGLQAIIKERG